MVRFVNQRELAHSAEDQSELIIDVMLTLRWIVPRHWSFCLACNADVDLVSSFWLVVCLALNWLVDNECGLIARAA